MQDVTHFYSMRMVGQWERQELLVFRDKLCSQESRVCKRIHIWILEQGFSPSHILIHVDSAQDTHVVVEKGGH